MKNTIFSFLTAAGLLFAGCHQPDELLPSVSRNGINSVTGAVGIPAIPTFTAPQIPMLASGGLIRTSGTVIVGEKGPEMLSLPRGAKVSPIDKSRRSENKFYINIYADGKSADEIVDELVPKLKLALDNM